MVDGREALISSTQVTAATKILNKDFGRVPHCASMFREAGFVDVVEKQMVWPIGTWAKDERMMELGRWAREDV